MHPNEKTYLKFMKDFTSYLVRLRNYILQLNRSLYISHCYEIFDELLKLSCKRLEIEKSGRFDEINELYSKFNYVRYHFDIPEFDSTDLEKELLEIADEYGNMNILMKYRQSSHLFSKKMELIRNEWCNLETCLIYDLHMVCIPSILK
ncbi:hypothetical protein AVEN_122683-1 [Araneus ventricosus]|uniref:Uncharacterized protein n=1 Tax=Araneus ventricosus TaxID=182803 RepID=A0A4Y2P8C6_ARAVE|nr:hypothetical protein AVEN_122683-1 [Araneus ventricosus]